MGLKPIIIDLFHLSNLHFGIHRKWYHETSEKLPFYLPFRLRFQLRPNRSGKPRIPHLLRCQGFAVKYYSFTLGALDLGHPRLLQR